MARVCIARLTYKEAFAEPINKDELTKEMLEKATQCNTAEELMAFAKAEGIELSIEEAEAYLDELSECELKDGDLKHVAGGKWRSCGDHTEESRY